MKWILIGGALLLAFLFLMSKIKWGWLRWKTKLLNAYI
jgi:hypothetical protein